MKLHSGSRVGQPSLRAHVAQTAVDSLHHTLLKAREPSADMERDYDKVYAFWLSMWRETFAAVDPSIQVHSDVFLRHCEISAMFSHDEVVGLIMYDWRKLRIQAHRDLSHFQHFPSDVIDALRARGHDEVMLMGQLTVHPKWRKQRVGPFMSDVLVGLSVKRFLESNASVMIAFTRNDRGTQELGYRFGAVPLREGHVAYGIASDVIAFYRDRVCPCPLPGLAPAIDRLWFGTTVPTRFSNLPKALEASPVNDVVSLKKLQDVDESRIRTVMIVGGGTAGWLSAAFLQRALPQVTVTLVESSDVPRVGVGEATIPTLASTLAFIGLDEAEWMRECNATFKSAIKFKNWRVGPSDPDDAFYHPFFPRPDPPIRPYGANHFQLPTEGFTSVHYWMQRAAAGDPVRYDYLASPIPRLCDEQRFGPSLRKGERQLRFAYHLDAGLFAAYLSKVCRARGVEHVIDHVSRVERREDGWIQTVHTAKGAALSADLFIDCSGFRSLLLGQSLEEPFVGDNDKLLCDRAVAMNGKTDPHRDGIRPYTIAHALDAGWSWNVPLFHRNGTGYVYCSAFADADRAEADLRALLGPSAEGQTANHIKMRVGYSERVWVGNCIGIGLSAMFLEPLESTSIFMTEYQLSNLVSLFPDRTFPVALRDRYNLMMKEVYEQIRDFIVLHYCTTQREDTPFWRAVRHDAKMPDSLQAILEGYREGILPTDFRTFHVFREQNWASVLSGMRCFPMRGPPILAHAGSDAAEARFAETQAWAEQLSANTPTHFGYLRGLHDVGRDD